jgi:DNA-binding response OmpR family regulator
VLVIEDDAIIGGMLLMYLNEEGFQVARKETGLEGLTTLGEFIPDIVLLDLMLPDIDGLDLCRRLREITKVPILILSMRDSVAKRVNALAEGADDFLCKPFSMHELIARMHALIRRSQPYRLMLDLETRSMHMRGEMVEMTLSEFEIMRCLIGSPGKVFSRNDLIHAIRGFDSFVTERAIDVHIANLRKKIEDNPKEPRRIRTVWGVGYKFVN